MPAFKPAPFLWGAHCDAIDTERPVPIWSVRIWSEGEHSHERTYDVEARSEDEAVAKAEWLFVDEMEALIE